MNDHFNKIADFTLKFLSSENTRERSSAFFLLDNAIQHLKNDCLDKDEIDRDITLLRAVLKNYYDDSYKDSKEDFLEILRSLKLKYVNEGQCEDGATNDLKLQLDIFIRDTEIWQLNKTAINNNKRYNALIMLISAVNTMDIQSVIILQKLKDLKVAARQYYNRPSELFEHKLIESYKAFKT